MEVSQSFFMNLNDLTQPVTSLKLQVARLIGNFISNYWITGIILQHEHQESSAPNPLSAGETVVLQARLCTFGGYAPKSLPSGTIFANLFNWC